MAKWCGQIGFSIQQETVAGVWTELIEERKYKGELIRNSRRLQNGVNINDDINISNQISIKFDPYAKKNFHNIKYAIFMGTKWKITDIEVQYPNLLLTLGGVYNA